MAYRILKTLLNVVIRIFYKNIIVEGIDKIPNKGPCILACTHPNSFLDAILVAGYSKRKIYFLARGDAFNTPFKMWLLNSLNLIPIYRIQEGAENLHKNEDTFEKCYEIFEKGHCILIFSEGISVSDKLVRRLKKGTARIAFGAEEKNDFKLDLKIIPIGINYNYPNVFRTDIIVRVNTPYLVNEYQEKYQESPVNCIKEFNNRLYHAIKEVCIVVDPRVKEEERLFETLAPIARVKGIENSNRLNREQEISKIKPTNELTELVNRYRELTMGFQENQIEHGSVNPFFMGIVHVLFAIFYFIGYLPNCLPVFIAKKITAKKVKTVEFYASVRLCLAMLLSIVYFPILTLLLKVVFGGSAILYFIFLICTGLIYVLVRDLHRKLKGANRFYSKGNPAETLQIREKLIQVLENN